MECLFHKLRSHPSFELGIFASALRAIFWIIPFSDHKKGTNPSHGMSFPTNCAVIQVLSCASFGQPFGLVLDDSSPRSPKRDQSFSWNVFSTNCAVIQVLILASFRQRVGFVLDESCPGLPKGDQSLPWHVLSPQIAQSSSF